MDEKHPRESELKEAADDGYAARMMGAEANENPFDETSDGQLRQKWTFGWTKANIDMSQNGKAYETAELEGERARAQGQPISTNPHGNDTATSDLKDAWTRGWIRHKARSR